MSYVINLTSGNVYGTIQDGTTNTSTGLTLIGRNYTSYGIIQNENFVKLLENFADTKSPDQSSNAQTLLTGTLWYDTGNNLLRVYDGSKWYPVSQRIVANAAPTADNIGDQWWDTVNSQLKSWTGSAWQVIGPSTIASYGKSGAIVETILGTDAVQHIVVNTYSNSNLISITNYGSSFTPNVAISGITTVQPGINLVGNAIINGNAVNSFTVGNINPTSFARVDQNSSFSNDILVKSNVVLGNVSAGYGNIHFTSNNNLVFHNHAYQGNVDVYLNTYTGNVNAIHIDGNTGLATVSGNAVSNFGIATKVYVDATVGAQVQDVQNVANQFYDNIQALQADYLANVNIIDGAISSLASSAQSNLTAAVTSINANAAVLNANLGAYQQWANANVTSLQSQIFSANTYVNAVVPTLAPFVSPALQGNPTTPYPASLTSYLNSINSLNLDVTFNTAMTLTTGEYIVQTDPISGYVLSNVQVLQNSVSSLVAEVTVISGTISTLANTNVFVNGSYYGGVHITAVNSTGQGLQFSGLGDSSTSIAPTSYVDATANLLYGVVMTTLNNEITLLAGATDSDLALKANIDSQTLTGTPHAPTPLPLNWNTSTTNPISGSNDTSIATTNFVYQSIASQKMNYTISTSAPSGGNDGDFWFQVQ